MSESVARMVFIALIVIVCEFVEHFFVRVDATRILIILILFEHIKEGKP